MTERVLFVDDEPNVLAGYRRVLGRRVDVATAESADEGLRLLRDEGPFAVVVSDLRMPGLDGMAFLQKVKIVHPDTVRVLLTGHADVDTAVEAINQDLIFRFVQKPCPPEVLRRVVAACVRHHRLLASRKVLLEGTLKGSVTVLTEVLGMVHPKLFSRCNMLGRAARQVAEAMGIRPSWHVEVAAMLCDLGCVTLSEETLARVQAGQPVSAEEQAAYDAYPEASARLLSSIPYLERVSRIIATHTQVPFVVRADEDEEARRVRVGAMVVHAVRCYVFDLQTGAPPDVALAALRKERVDERVLDALTAVGLEESEMPLQSVPLDGLLPGMILDQDVRAKNQVLLVTRGQEVTATTVSRLRGFASSIGVEAPIRVRCPRGLNAA